MAQGRGSIVLACALAASCAGRPPSHEGAGRAPDPPRALDGGGGGGPGADGGAAPRCAAWTLELQAPFTVPGIGGGQGVAVDGDRVLLFGDAATGVLREHRLDETGALVSTGRDVALTEGGVDRVRHPTGLALDVAGRAFLGDTVGGEGTIFVVDLPRALAAGTLDGAILHEVPDDAARDGSRPEMVILDGRRVVATADYGDVDNEVRLYDPEALLQAGSTSEPGVLVARFSSGPFVQSSCFLADEGVLVLVQNTTAFSGWRLSFVDLAASVEAGSAVVLDVLEPAAPGELEGAAQVAPGRFVFVTSAATDNVRFGALRCAASSSR